MKGMSGFIRRQGELILTNDRFALFNIIVLVLFPYTGWLASAIIALITLRKGWKSGANVLFAALGTHFIVLKLTTHSTVNEAVLATLLSYMPCYLAAVTLYLTQSWRAVAGVLSLQVLLVLSLIQLGAPDFMMQQVEGLRELLSQLQFETPLLLLNQDGHPETQMMFAHYLFGVQAAGVALASMFSLTLARYIQSILFYPEGFKSEMRALRGGRVDLMLLLLVFVLAKQHSFVAIDVLPIVLLFFFVAGLSLWFDCMARSALRIPLLVLSVVLGLLPHVMLTTIVLFGALDTLFNFRVFLHNRAAKAIGEVK